MKAIEGGAMGANAFSAALKKQRERLIPGSKETIHVEITHSTPTRMVLRVGPYEVQGGSQRELIERLSEIEAA